MKQIFVYRYHGYPEASVPDFPEGFNVRLLVYHWFSKVRGWHPRQVDDLTLEEVEWLPLLDEASELSAELISKEIQAQKR